MVAVTLLFVLAPVLSGAPPVEPSTGPPMPEAPDAEDAGAGRLSEAEEVEVGSDEANKGPHPAQRFLQFGALYVGAGLGSAAGGLVTNVVNIPLLFGWLALSNGQESDALYWVAGTVVALSFATCGIIGTVAASLLVSWLFDDGPLWTTLFAISAPPTVLASAAIGTAAGFAWFTVAFFAALALAFSSPTAFGAAGSLAIGVVGIGLIGPISAAASLGTAALLHGALWTVRDAGGLVVE